ncbi:MAG TPA: response regulator [Bacteroidales bacterium]|nr:response regulator [Bacteroidales bacterium]
MMKKILLVDNDAFSRMLIKTVAVSADTDFIECENGREALKAFNRNTISVVFLNTRLPDVNGRELLRLFKEKRPDIPIIGLSAEDPFNFDSCYQDVSFDCFFGIPFELSKFQEQVRIFCN